MTTPVGTTQGVREAAPVVLDAPVLEEEGAESAVSLASERTTRAESSLSDGPRVTREQQQRLAGVMAYLSDPLVLQGMAQALVRDAQINQQERGIEIEKDRADEAADRRVAALEEARKKAEEAKGWGVFAQVATRVAAIAAAVALTVSGAFTGGAGAVAAVGLLIVAFGNDLALAMSEAGVDQDVTNAIGIGASVVGTCCTLGASAASLAGTSAQAGAAAAQSSANAAAQSASTAANSAANAAAQSAGTAAQTAAQSAVSTVKTAADVVESGARIAAGAGQIANGVSSHESTQRTLDSEQAHEANEAALDRMDDAVELAREFMESYRKIVRSIQASVEAENEAMSVAMQRRA